jgi:hypothetical protein
MQRYRNLNGHSGVRLYEIGPDYIMLAFGGGDDAYVYTHARPGRAEVEHMKSLARRGQGLSTFVAQHVRENYEFKVMDGRWMRSAAPAPARGRAGVDRTAVNATRRPRAGAPTRTGTSPRPPPR